MPRQFEDVIVKNTRRANKKNEFYPFYMYRKNSKSRSSLSSLHNRRAPRLVKRLVRKCGKTSLHRNTNNSQHHLRYLLDLSNTLIESRWIWTIISVSLAFISTWLLFAGLWMVVNIDNIETVAMGVNNTENCLEGIEGFTGYLLFSIETQSTIGYGNRYINSFCPEAVFLMCVQIIVGVSICGSLICIVYLKMVAPNKLHSMTSFSRFAVVCLRDSELNLIFRVRDPSNKYECYTQICAYLVQRRRGELCLKSLKLEPPGLLIWPVEVIHVIDKDSPFWDISAKDLLTKKFEVIVVMDGTSLSTSSMSRTTTSYLTKEIKWGYRFKNCTNYESLRKSYIVDHSLFNETEEIATPLCSAKRLEEVYKDILELAVPEVNLSPSTSEYPSPFFNQLKIFQTHCEDEDKEIGNISTSITTSVVVHMINEIKSEKEKQGKIDGSDDDDTSSSEEITFQDLVFEELTEINLQSYESLRTSDLYASLENFIIEDNTKRLKNKKDPNRKYYETSF